MIQVVGNISEEHKNLVSKIFQESELVIKFVNIEDLIAEKIISLDKNSTIKLQRKGFNFYNWDLLFSVLGPNDTEGEITLKIRERVSILKAILSLKSHPVSDEFHASIRVMNLAMSSRFYTWLFGVEPKEWTHRYVTFVRKDTQFNFVLLVSDGNELHHDTLYHLGMGVSSKEKVIEFYHSAVSNGFHIEKPPRTTWRGTPLHELWLKDPDGTLIEIYARLTPDELANMPADKEPIFLA